ncbi:MAG: SRPBCC family protein [Saprospiraceae bacterium]
MKALKYLLYTVLGLATLFLLLALFARHDYHIERDIEIDAPREIVYDQVRFFKNAPNWSPWLYLDPNVKTSIEGTDGEPGAVYKWSGNKDIGTGSQTLQSVKPNRLDLLVSLSEFSASPAYFTLAEEDKMTTVTWAMDMHVPFPWNALSMLTDMNNGFIAKDFENGLANLKKYCEALAPKKYRGFEVLQVERPTAHYAAVRQVVDFQNIPQFFTDNFPKAIQESGKAGAKMTGHPSGLFWSYDTVALNTDMAAAIPLDKQVKTGNGVQVVTVGGKALVIDYLGDYAKTAEARSAMDDYMAEKKLQYIPPVIEEYVTDPGQEPDTSKWLTRVIYFVTAKVDSTAVEKK